MNKSIAILLLTSLALVGCSKTRTELCEELSIKISPERAQHLESYLAKKEGDSITEDELGALLEHQQIVEVCMNSPVSDEMLEKELAE